MGTISRAKGRKIFMLRWQQHGVRVTESSGTDDEQDARRLLAVKEGKVAEGSIPTIRGGKITFGEAARLIRDDYEANERAFLGRLEGKLETHIIPALGAKRLALVNTAAILRYRRDRLATGSARATVNRELAIIKRVFTLARRVGLVQTIPHIDMLQERNARTGFFEREQFEAVLAHLPPYLVGPITFAYWTGWRVPSEVLTLKWAQVDRGRQTVRLEPNATKNDEGRTFPYGQIPEIVHIMNAAWEARCKGPWVFHADGRRILSEPKLRFYDPWKTACAAAGVAGRIPHDFRRTAVRNLTRAGVPEKIAMTITGHKTRSVFDRYDIIAEDDLELAVTRLVSRKDRPAK
jgi:integrase